MPELLEDVAWRGAALAKMRDELRYRIESCPCGGVPDNYVELEVRAESPPAGPA